MKSVRRLAYTWCRTVWTRTTSARLRSSRDATLPAIAFIGDMSYFPNVEAAIFFAREVFPLIRSKVREAAGF